MASPYSYFATVLTDILAAHDLILDDLDSERFRGNASEDDLRLHPETIRRLKQSLIVERMYYTLSKQNVAKLIKLAQLHDNERLRLIAAIVATKVQAELAPRISPRRAYLAAERLMPLIVEGMQELEETEEFDGIFKSNEGTTMPEFTEFDKTYYDALTAIDRGLLALNAIRFIDDIYEKRAVAQQAFDAFSFALMRFDARPETSAIWNYWHHEALEGQTDAQQFLV